MTTPLYDATLADLLAASRARADAAESRAAEMELRLREARVREALLVDQARAEEAARVRDELVAAKPLPELVIDLGSGDDEPVAPPVPAFADLRVPEAKVGAFFDALIGP